jgi:GDPmannose 4,6-dehydratase
VARRALVTGIGGQDGSLLAELLLAEGYEVYGTVRSPEPYENLDGIGGEVEVGVLDLLDEHAVANVIERTRPHEVYHLASVSFAPASWEDPISTARVGTIAVVVLLEQLRRADHAIRYCQASSSEIFGAPDSAPQTERTPMCPLNPYGAAKAFAFSMAQGYRRRHRLFACSAILYNHESERRPPRFLPRKVARGAAAIPLGLEIELVLGDLHPRRDWGAARDYVDAMWRMLQHPEPHDFVIATGEAHTVEELVVRAFDRVGLDWRAFVRADASLQRGEDAAVDLVGDPSKARELLGWEPKTSFDELVNLLVDAEVERLHSTG